MWYDAVLLLTYDACTITKDLIKLKKSYFFNICVIL